MESPGPERTPRSSKTGVDVAHRRSQHPEPLREGSGYTWLWGHVWSGGAWGGEMVRGSGASGSWSVVGNHQGRRPVQADLPLRRPGQFLQQGGSSGHGCLHAGSVVLGQGRWGEERTPAGLLELTRPSCWSSCRETAGARPRWARKLPAPARHPQPLSTPVPAGHQRPAPQHLGPTSSVNVPPISASSFVPPPGTPCSAGHTAGAQ